MAHRGKTLCAHEIIAFNPMMQSIARAVHRTVIDQSQLEQNQLQQLTMALKQQMLKELRENRTKKV